MTGMGPDQGQGQLMDLGQELLVRHEQNEAFGMVFALLCLVVIVKTIAGGGTMARPLVSDAL